LARFFSLDHNVVGLQYALTSLFFLLIGFSLAILFRWQLAYPGQPVPIGGRWLGELNAPGGMMLPEFYNQLVAMHYGTIMGPESGNRMLAVVRSRALPHARVLHDSNARRFRRLARKPTSGTLTRSGPHCGKISEPTRATKARADPHLMKRASHESRYALFGATDALSGFLLQFQVVPTTPLG